MYYEIRQKKKIQKLIVRYKHNKGCFISKSLKIDLLRDQFEILLKKKWFKKRFYIIPFVSKNPFVSKFFAKNITLLVGRFEFRFFFF